jgi:hypothetical protein
MIKMNLVWLGWSELRYYEAWYEVIQLLGEFTRRYELEFVAVRKHEGEPIICDIVFKGRR